MKSEEQSSDFLLGARVWRPNMDATDYHRFSVQYKTALTRIWKSKIPDADKQLIERFVRDCKTKGTGFARLTKLVRNLAIIGELLGKPFQEATIEDIKRVVHHFEAGDFSVWTKHDVKVILKQFYKWLDGEDYPKIVKWICTTIPHKEKPLTQESDLLSEDEVNKVIAAADHPRNKAIIAILAESGARVGEIGNLTIGQVKIDASGTVLTVSGKTGRRRLRIISATSYLLKWLDIHPDKSNPYAPLWINIGTKDYHKQMTYEGVRKVLIETFKKAGLKKRCHPYIFRHSRASQLARHLTEFQMNSYFGWIQGSRMPAMYVHISGKDLDEDILRINGLKLGEKPVPYKPQMRACQRCREINSPDALYCCKCAEIVDPSLALKSKLEETDKPAVNVKSPFLEWVQNDPELRSLLKRKATEFKEALSQPSQAVPEGWGTGR
ncbi:tyrosine-type recombinase/integrase [Candidatus Woesearchaeota archaeon]|nr:tyrosine-type recombinase/integrase [Candidatus Woesearchaeota archaeon]